MSAQLQCVDDGVWQLSGAVDCWCAGELERVARTFWKQQVPHVIDCTQLEQGADSSLLALLIGWLRHAHLAQVVPPQIHGLPDSLRALAGMYELEALLWPDADDTARSAGEGV